jgi:hypothetical protein
MRAEVPMEMGGTKLAHSVCDIMHDLRGWSSYWSNGAYKLGQSQNMVVVHSHLACN